MKSRRKQGGRVVGFVITPDAIKGKVEALDNAIAVLDGDIRSAPASKLSASWRAEWDAFRRRWAVERDSYANWSARLFATYVMPRLDAFESNYRYWAREYQRKTGRSAAVAEPAEVETMSASLVPDAVWWILGGVAALYVLTGRR
jgi:hypothetical protein